MWQCDNGLDDCRKSLPFVLVGTIHEKEDGPAKGIVYAGWAHFDGFFFVVDVNVVVVDNVVDNFYRCLMFESFWSSSQIKAIVIIELSN